MLETFLSGSVLARLINSALRLDPAARDKLAALNGRRISLDLGWGERPWLIEIHGGELHFSDDHATLCDVRLSGNLSGFLQLFKKPANSSTPPRGKLYIEGDLHAAQQFQRVMGELAPDFDAVFRERFGEPLLTPRVACKPMAKRAKRPSKPNCAPISAKTVAPPAVKPPTSPAACKRSPPALPASKPA